MSQSERQTRLWPPIKTTGTVSVDCATVISERGWKVISWSSSHFDFYKALANVRVALYRAIVIQIHIYSKNLSAGLVDFPWSTFAVKDNDAIMPMAMQTSAIVLNWILYGWC